MQQILANFQAKIKTFCRPNPKLYPDPSVHQFFWTRNIMNMYSCSIFSVVTIAFVTGFSSLPSSANVFLFTTNIFHLMMFLLSCRSYPWVYSLVYMFLVLALGYICLEEIKEAAYYYIGYAFVLPTSVLLRTGDARLNFIGGLIQIYICLTKFKEKLIILVAEESPEVFASRFVKVTSFFLFMILLLTIALVKALNKRTVELSRAKYALENSLEQQKTFIFSFSHELRNPINSLLGNLQLVLQSENLSARAAEMINTAKTCSEILLHGINNVLDVGKHEIGKLELNPVPTQLHELFQKTWSIYSELLRQKKLKGHLKIEKDLPAMLKIDPHKLNQILLNLVGNAIKFTEKGSVMVTVQWLKSKEINGKCFEPVPYDDTDEGLFEKEENLSTINPSIKEFKFLSGSDETTPRHEVKNHQEEIQGILKIIVKDTGSGMKKESLEKLFQKFSQVSENASQRQIGTGLGLFITKEICLAMQGEICAYSKFGKGSTFVVCIPTISVPNNEVQKANSESILKRLKAKHLKALVADDSPFNVNLISNYFGQFEASVRAVAYNGYDILMKYKEKMAAGVGVDVVILDIDMPVMDGRTVCDKIREYEQENKLKPVLIILISGNYDKNQVEGYVNPEKDHRADFFLRKPVSLSEFSRALYNLVSPS